jgi:rhamnogalacturonyl hydrolase YesR/lysophospholipase L1-like esterase
MKKISLFLLLLIVCPIWAQKKNTITVNDINTPLHLLQPEYETPYGMISIADVTADMERILTYLDEATPARVVHKETGKVITDYAAMDSSAMLEQGVFRLTSYEWGVTYAAMLAAAETTGDSAFRKYTETRFSLLAETAPHFRRQMFDYGKPDFQMKPLLTPHALDDAGAMCAAMIKSQPGGSKQNLRPLIDNYINYIMYREHRLSDGTFARNRPQKNTLWLDDMFMSVPAIVQMGKLTGEAKYFNEAARQIKQFSERMFVKEKGLYVHGWVEGIDNHPGFHWGRANGWAVLSMTEVLDVLPENHPDYQTILKQYRAHIRGIAACQSGKGFWHQLLDRNDSYLETSATAIFVYCIARGINKGWIDPIAYGPVAHLGWHAVAGKINEKGQVEGVCVGTGMSFDPAYYYYRPVSVSAAHGYGPVIMAGAEIINLMKKKYPKKNDNAIHYYDTEQTTMMPIFGITRHKQPSGSSRIGKKYPVIFKIGDSTMKNGNGKGENGQWGWGSLFSLFLDSSRISSENHALGGRSSRTFYTEGLWEHVLEGIHSGDYLIVQFGHNDGGPFNTGRARASLRGIGNESQTFIMEKHGGQEEVFTFGHYLRIYIRQAKARGANVIILSHTPGNYWDNDKIKRNNETYGKWSKEVAEQENVSYLDANALIADRYEAMGKESVKKYFADGVHTNYAGAFLNAKIIAEGILNLSGFNLKEYIRPETLQQEYKETDTNIKK